jgi:Methyltransferase domain
MTALSRSSIISRAAKVEGWFDEVELDLLIRCVEYAALRQNSHNNHINIVEIGSYKGRSTVAIGLAVVALSLDATVYAIDPHEGVRSGRFDGIHKGPETYFDFLSNIKHFGLEKYVKCLRLKSTEANSDFPISLILIDGLHDLKNISEDFRHFEKNLVPGCIVAFHDYRNEFPGVVEFVDSLMCVKNAVYTKLDHVHSLMVVEKAV